MVALIAIIFVLISGTCLYVYNAQGTNYVFLQTDWSGGQTADVASHATNQTNWNEYEAKDTDVITGADLAITSGVASTINQTTNTDFSLGAQSSTKIFGTGDSAAISLLPASGDRTKFTSTGAGHSCAVTESNKMYCWGWNTSGQLGNNGTSNSNTPVRVLKGAASGSDSDGTYLINVVSVSQGYEETCAATQSGNAYCWGRNNYGQGGDGTTAEAHTPVRVKKGAATGADTDGTYLINVASVSNGYDHSCATTNSGNVYCWGNDNYGQIGNSTVSGLTTTPARVQAGAAIGADVSGTYLTNVKLLSVGMYSSSACVVTQSDNLYCWGRNTGGQLGDNTTTNSLVPVRVLAGAATGADSDGTYIKNIASISGDNVACAVTKSGGAYCWGSNSNYQFGNNTNVSSSVPVRVLAGAATGADSDGTYLQGVASMDIGSGFACAVTQTNNIYCWGGNAKGQLGDNTTTLKKIPNRVLAGSAVGADANGGYLANIASVSAGGANSCALSQSGNIYCCGDNFVYELGDGSFAANRLIPSRVTGELRPVYSVSGTYTSSVIDAGTQRLFGALDYQSSAPTNTALAVDVRMGNVSVPDGTWTSWGTSIANGGSIVSFGSNRYLQYRVSLSTSSTSVAPSLSSITFSPLSSGGEYALISSPYNTQRADSTISNVQWEEVLPINTDIKFQIRTSSDGLTWGLWCGPDNGVSGSCSSSAYFTDQSGGEAVDDIQKDGSNDQYFQYKALLSSTNSVSTPTLSNMSISYAFINAPVVTTQAASNITSSAATLSANIADTGGENPVRYIEWGNAPGIYTDSCTVGSGSIGSYSCNISNLPSNTTYYYRAKATNSAGTIYGSELSFAVSTVCGAETAFRDGVAYGTVVGPDGRCWLDRNLGAAQVATSASDANSYGWYFQWGRPTDGHQLPNSSTVEAQSSSDVPGHPNFIYHYTDWRYPVNPALSTVWGSVSGTSNPCPTGFRPPTNAEMTALATHLSPLGSVGAFNSALKISLNGYRYNNDATLNNRGVGGYATFWTSDANNYLFRLYPGASDSIVQGSATGSAVRCTKDGAVATIATAATQSVSNITTVSATGNGNIAAVGGEDPTRFIEWGIVSGSYTDSCSAGIGATGTYSCNLTGLSPNTTYFYRAKAVNSYGTSYGNELSFSTNAGAPVVATNTASGIATTSATMNAMVTSIGGGNPTRYIEWGTASGNYTNSCTAGIGSTGLYSCALTGLSPDTIYYYRAKTTNANGTAYGNEFTFTTIALQDIIIPDPDSTKVTNAVIGGYMTVGSGTVASTDSAETNVNVTFRTANADVVFPKNTQTTEALNAPFNFSQFITTNVTSTVKQQNNASVVAVKIGIPGTNLLFSRPVTISIAVGAAYDGQIMDIQYQHDGDVTWYDQGVCTITGGKCSFQTDHATTYTVNGNGDSVGQTGINLNTDVQEVISLDCGSTTINLGNITPGTPITGSSTCTATTNANGGYNLSVRRDDATSTLKKDTESSITISDLTPWDPSAPNSNAWSGNGLGFTVFHSTANKNFAWWGTGTTLTDSNNKYAGFNTTQSDIMRNSTYAATSTATDIGYMLNVPPTQKSGAYSGSVTYQVVTTP